MASMGWPGGRGQPTDGVMTSVWGPNPGAQLPPSMQQHPVPNYPEGVCAYPRPGQMTQAMRHQQTMQTMRHQQTMQTMRHQQPNAYAPQSQLYKPNTGSVFP